MSLLSLPSSLRYYLYNGTTDMRKSYNGLAIVVRSELGCSPLNGDVFIFLNKHRNQVKLLLWEGDGFGIYQKRLEKGSFELPKQGADGPGMTLTHQQLHFILQGVDLKSVQFRKRYQCHKQQMV